MTISNDQRLRLIETAAAAGKNAYAPYSNFTVGAAVLTVAGDVFAGCNVENASYGLSICAERAAICSAIVGGKQEFVAIAIVADGMPSPCGACRQFIHEFGRDIEVFSAEEADLTKFKSWKINELLVDGFSPDNLK